MTQPPSPDAKNQPGADFTRLSKADVLELLHYKTELEAVERISQALFQSIDLDELVETTLHIALEEVGAEAGSILLADPEKEELIFQYSIGDKPVPRGTGIAWDKGISGAVFQSGKARITNQVNQDTTHIHSIDQTTGFITHDMITVPLRRWRGEPIGVLNALNKRAGPFTNHDLSLLTIISAFAALAIQQSKQFEDAKKAEVVTLLGDIGHDLKNLLTPVCAGMELLRGEVNELFDGMSPTELSEKHVSKEICDEAGEMAQNGIRRINDRVQEMADCVKGLSAPPNFKPCAVWLVILEVFKTLQVLARDKQIALRTEGLESLPEFLADERRLYNAFYNLINNAIPETPPGGSITVRGHLDQETGGIALAVTDTGRGMLPEIRDRLFSAKAISTKKGGTGLGTKIVKDVVDAHKGKIWVESEPGVGTTFHLRFPLDPRTAHPQFR
ncbi:MAG TPA: HAMP domain-containing sensor histidine kinase [Nitrospiraceae bacterium]|nr:HAMP domain-containing sensor histidine kinase [Nitrospiraceae bacterium]